MPSGVYQRTEEGLKNLSLAHKGYIMPEEQKNKISEGVKKRLPSTTFKKGIRVWNKGIHIGLSPESQFKKGHIVSLETRKRLSEVHKGNKSYLWKGGVTPERERIRHSIEYRLWRESVFARDHWNCQNCGSHGYMHAHHIKPFADYSELRFAIDNGITLCKSCHKKVHTRTK